MRPCLACCSRPRNPPMSPGGPLMLFVIFVGLVCLAASAYFVGDAVTMPARERRTSVRRAVTGARGVLFFSLVLAGFGFIGPDFLVSAKARSRKDRIRSELPDALDLMAVSVEAGMGFDGAISKLTEHMKGPLADEFALTLGEIRIGESRQDALKKLADRTSTPELSSFVRSIIQADQLGISLGRILRVQATDSRNKRQAAAEEKAMKAPIKMLFPT